MSKKPQENTDADFSARRQRAREEVNKLDRNSVHTEPERDKFFNTVYDRANDDAAQIPWADLAPKPQLANWLSDKSGTDKSALDIACGLGDNAEAISASGYETTAFDLASTAIEWAKQRFENTNVNYITANLFEPPASWRGGFDLVNECYTLQALPPQMLEKTTAAIAGLVADGGSLLIYTRLRKDDAVPDGPPWPLRHGDAMRFTDFGFDLISEELFENKRGDRAIPHQFAHWVKTT